MTSTRATISDLVEMIYRAAIEPEIWPTIVREMSDLFKGAGSVFVHDTSSLGLAMEISHGFDAKFIDSFKDYYASTNPLLLSALQAPESRVMHLFDLVSKDVYENSEYFSDWVMPQRLYASLGTRIRIDDTTSMFATFHRSSGDPDFSASDIEQFAQLLPHLRRGAEIGARLDRQAGIAAATASALDQLGVGAFLLTREGAVNDLNAEAQRLIEDEIFLRLQLGRLVPTETEQVGGFRHRLKQVADNHIGDTIVLQTRHGASVQGLVVPVAASSPLLGGSQRQVLLLIKANSESSGRVGDFMQETFRLTLAERRLLDALMSGKTLNEFCALNGISRNTAKTHLKNLFQKTGTSRQSALVRMASRSSMI